MAAAEIEAGGAGEGYGQRWWWRIANVEDSSADSNAGFVAVDEFEEKDDKRERAAGVLGWRRSGAERQYWLLHLLLLLQEP